MPDITLVKRGELALSAADSSVVRRVLFEWLGGLGERDQKSWRRFWNFFLRAEAGEMVTIKTATKRIGVFHRRHMLIESRVFEAQERIKDFDQFRLWLKLGAGFVDWMAGPRGGVVPVPKSISYGECDEVEFREFHDAAMAFLRTDHAMAYLWPKLPAKQRCDAIDTLLLPFEE